MSRADKKRLAVIVTVIMGILALFFVAVTISDGKPANTRCYQDFRAAYTWSEARPALDKLWENDQKLTRGECSKITSIYLDATRANAVNETRKVMNSYGK